MNNNTLPADPSSLILGIVALVIGIAGCCCYGIIAIVPLILGIIGLVMANRSIKEYDANPEGFSAVSRSNMVTAKVINIIAVVLNGILFLFFGIILLIYGSILSAAVFSGLQDIDDSDNPWSDDAWEESSWDNDTIYKEDDKVWEYEKDTLLIKDIEVNDTIEN
tara:strand:+ start:109 stop:600 length:492 start_codon:yes stop_codon:yes gene_type:complete